MTTFSIDIEEWKLKEFLKYIKLKLNERGINYSFKYPFDVVMVGSFIKRFKKEGKTNYFVKKVLDKIFENFNIEDVQSLAFLHALDERTEKKEPMKKFKDLDFTFSDELKQKLAQLKKEVKQKLNGKET